MLPYTSGSKPIRSASSRSAAREPGWSPSASVSNPRPARYEPVVTCSSALMVTTGNPASNARSMTSVPNPTSPVHSTMMSEWSIRSSIEWVNTSAAGKSASVAMLLRVSTRLIFSCG